MPKQGAKIYDDSAPCQCQIGRYLYIEPKCDIAVLDDVILAFHAQFARIFSAMFALAGDEVAVGDYFRTNEAALEIVWITPAACGAVAPTKRSTPEPLSHPR